CLTSFFPSKHPPTSHIYTLSLHDALPIYLRKTENKFSIFFSQNHISSHCQIKTCSSCKTMNCSNDWLFGMMHSHHQIIGFSKMVISRDRIPFPHLLHVSTSTKSPTTTLKQYSLYSNIFISLLNCFC